MTPKHVPVAALLRVFLWLGTTTYGGGQSAAIRREVVRSRGWLTDEEYLELRSIALISPGPNSPNLALLIGLRLSGTIGAILSYAAASVPSTIILLLLGALALDPQFPALRAALRGCAAAAVGLTVANALELTAIYRSRVPQLLVVAAAAVCVVFAHLSLWATLLAFVPISFALTKPVAAT
ncbi:MAG TPA: chromate transporter [Candidatus Binatia bacterium]|nr:chromate transporter [Candidatus Binatia bacterium]